MAAWSSLGSSNSGLFPSAFRLDAQTLALVGVALLAVLVVQYIRYARGKIHLPGPLPLPIVGNLMSLGPDHALTYHEWSKIYGPVFKVTLGEREIVIVNSAAAAKELFGDQGSVYISRPIFHNFHKVVSSTAGFTIGTSPWDESCKRKRRAAATALNRNAVQTYVPIIEREVLALVEDLYAHGKAGKEEIQPFAYFQRYALNTSLTVNYGVRLDAVGDDLLQEIVETETIVSDFRSVSNQWSDYIPLLRIMPAFHKNTAALATQARVRRDKYMAQLLNDLKDRVKNGTDMPCITGNILKDPDAKLDDLELSSICLSMVSAGLDTLANTFIWSVGFLAKHPEIQDKAFEEITKVYQGEVPDPNEETVEYITALGKEASRYFSVLKLSLPRATLGDSEYHGVHIPSDTTVFLNAWAIHHDADRYGDVHNFRPERFLNESEADRQSHFSFGAGRRMCAGTHLANREMYIAYCNLIYNFKIVPGAEDYDIEPETACDNPAGLSSSPKPFKIKFVPRDSAGIEEWIEAQKARTELQMAKSITHKA